MLLPAVHVLRPACDLLEDAEVPLHRLLPRFGETLNIAPCNCYRLRVCLCFGSPCYDFCGVPYFVGLKNAAEFSLSLIHI